MMIVFRSSEIWREEFGEELSEDEARLHATRLLELYLLLATRSDEEGASDSDSRARE